MKYYVDTWSRVDLSPIAELRRTEDKKLLLELERGDVSELTKAGWQPPEVFTAMGRDGKTDIWGIIIRPTNFDPSKKYPVIETIYAGPQGSFTPKSFSAYSPMQSLAELGFIVVQMDGMGTANRSKAFHDVAWKNLGDFTILSALYVKRGTSRHTINEMRCLWMTPVGQGDSSPPLV